jgi:Tol biopolymer transport system component
MNRIRGEWLGALLVTATAALIGASSAGATFHGRNGRIAFTDFMSGQMYAVNPNGTGLDQLTSAGPNRLPIWPDWAPNGRRIVFSSDGGPDRGAPIKIIHANGSHERRLSHDKKGFRDYDPNYTPDGHHLVFARCKPNDGVCAIWKMRLNGSRMHALTPYVEPPGNERIDFFPSVAPNGKRIAFSRSAGEGFNSRIFVMHTDGSHAHSVTPPRLEGFAPDWAPGGGRLVFSSDSLRTGSSLFTIRPNGHGLRRVTPSRYPHNDALGAFSPRGNRLAFISDRNYPDGCCNDLFTVGLQGGAEHMVDTGAGAGILFPDWGTHPLAP